jgi:hypothetical protein
VRCSLLDDPFDDVVQGVQGTPARACPGSGSAGSANVASRG